MNRADHHQHHHAPADFNRAFAIGVALNVIFIILEVVAGFWADSLALLTDAGHNVSDVLGLLLAWGAAALASRATSSRRTYGYSRATILASLASGLLLFAAVGAIVWEALSRLRDPAIPQGFTMIWVAGVGVVINGLTAMLFFSGKDHDLNIRGAFLHMAADAGVSLGVVIGGLVILGTAWYWVDPALSLLIAAVILASTWGLLRDSTNLALDAVPRAIDPGEVREFLASLPGVADLHDLHIWAMSTTDTALTAHLVMPEAAQSDDFLRNVTGELQRRFRIGHATLQIEQDRDAARCEDCDTVRGKP